MPKKPRKGRAFYSKKRKIKPPAPAPVAPPPAASPPPKAVVTPPAARPLGAKPAVQAARYPYIIAELKSISLISGIILVILIVLAVVLT